MTPKPAASVSEVLRNRDLLRLDFGIFSVHAILMSVFMQVPFVLRGDGLECRSTGKFICR